MKYKEAMFEAMKLLAQDDLVRFIGYSVKYGSKGYGGFNGIDEKKLIETPVAENLMAGMATGMALTGLRPVLYFERFDFVLNALDSIVNHLDKIEQISDGDFSPKVVIRIVVGGGEKKPLFSGPTHTQDFTEALDNMVSFPVIRIRTPDAFLHHYKEAAKWDRTVALVEERDLYEA